MLQLYNHLTLERKKKKHERGSTHNHRHVACKMQRGHARDNNHKNRDYRDRVRAVGLRKVGTQTGLPKYLQ